MSSYIFGDMINLSPWALKMQAIKGKGNLFAKQSLFRKKMAKAVKSGRGTGFFPMVRTRKHSLADAMMLRVAARRVVPPYAVPRYIQ